MTQGRIAPVDPHINFTKMLTNLTDAGEHSMILNAPARFTRLVFQTGTSTLKLYATLARVTFSGPMAAHLGLFVRALSL